jgi:UrcA family protein
MPEHRAVSSFVAAVASAVAALPAATPAAAAGPEPSRAFKVAIPIHDLDLATDEGRRALVRRSRVAAERTCAPEPHPVGYDTESVAACRAAFDQAAEAALARAGGSRRAG